MAVAASVHAPFAIGCNSFAISVHASWAPSATTPALLAVSAAAREVAAEGSKLLTTLGAVEKAEVNGAAAETSPAPAFNTLPSAVPLGERAGFSIQFRKKESVAIAPPCGWGGGGSSDCDTVAIGSKHTSLAMSALL